MSSEIDAVRLYFDKLGFESDIADIYLALHAYGRQTISELARSSGVERTRIYRLMATLKRSSLVEVETHAKREVFRAAPLTNLQIVLSHKEEELKELQSELGRLHEQLGSHSLISPLTRVQFYSGQEGNKQMYWNETRARSEVLCILSGNMQSKVGPTFFDRWVRRCNEKGLHHRGIVSEEFMRTQREWYEQQKHRNERLLHWQQRQVATSVFPVTHNTVTYDDVVAYYNWKDGEVFGIEIYNKEIAQAQRHFFEMLWQISTPAPDVKIVES